MKKLCAVLGIDFLTCDKSEMEDGTPMETYESVVDGQGVISEEDARELLLPSQVLGCIIRDHESHKLRAIVEREPISVTRFNNGRFEARWRGAAIFIDQITCEPIPHDWYL